MIKTRMKNYKNYPLLKYYFFTYVVVLLIPLLICCSSYHHMISMISEDDAQVKKAELRHASVLIDTMFDEFSYLGDSLAGNMEVNAFKHEKDVFAYPKSYSVIELQKALPESYQINQSIFDFYIFFDQSEVVINKRIAYKYKDFYNLYLKERDSESYEKWYHQIKNNRPEYGIHPVETYLYKGKEKNMLTYTRPLLTNGVSVDNSAVQIYFEEAVLETFMPTLSKGDIQCITDQKGNILYFRGDGDVLWDEKSIISMVRKSVLDTEKTNTDVENVASETFVKIGRDKYFVVWYNSS